MQFRRVDSDIVDRLIPKDDAPESVLNEEQQNALKEEIEAIVPDKTIYKVAFAPMSPTAPPVTITQSEFMRRMKEQQRVGGGGGMAMFGDMPDSYDVVFNANHPLVTSWTEGDAEGRKPKWNAPSHWPASRKDCCKAKSSPVHCVRLCRPERLNCIHEIRTLGHSGPVPPRSASAPCPATTALFA